MKTKIFAVSILMCLLASLPLWAAQTAIDAKSIVGSWKISSVDTGEGAFPISGKLIVAKKADGTADVQYSGGFGGGTVSGAKLDGNKLTFVVASQGFNGEETKSNYEFTLADTGKLSGKTSGGRGGERQLVGTRMWPRPDCVGQWEMKTEMGGNVTNSKLVISVNDAGKLTGKWTMQMGENEMTSDLSDIKFEKGKLSFTRTMTRGENQTTSKFEGEVKGDEISGKSVSGRGDMIVKGTRIGKDIIGTWELNVKSDMGDMTGKLIVDKDLSAVYTIYFTGFGGETTNAPPMGFDMDVTNLKQDGSNITFSAGMGQFSQEFKGKLTGDKIEGEMTSDMGASKITGKKVVSKPAATSAETKKSAK